MTDLIKAILGFCAFLGVCALAEHLRSRLTEYAPGWIWLLLFLAIPAGLVMILSILIRLTLSD